MIGFVCVCVCLCVCVCVFVLPSSYVDFFLESDFETGVDGVCVCV